MVITIGDLHMKNGKKISNGIIMRERIDYRASSLLVYLPWTLCSKAKWENLLSLSYCATHFVLSKRCLDKKNDSLYIYNSEKTKIDVLKKHLSILIFQRLDIYCNFSTLWNTKKPICIICGRWSWPPNWSHLEVSLICWKFVISTNSHPALWLDRRTVKKQLLTPLHAHKVWKVVLPTERKKYLSFSKKLQIVSFLGSKILAEIQMHNIMIHNYGCMIF